MRKFVSALLIIMLNLSLLAGCGNAAAKEEEDKSFISDAAGVIYKEMEQEAAGEATVIGEAFLDNEIENNGGYFVRAGDRVYFRLYGPESLDPVTVGTDVLNNGTPAGGSRIMYYDTKSKEVVEAFKDDGFGRLYLASDGFWLCRNVSKGEEEAPDTVLYWVSEDGSRTKDAGQGVPAGVSFNGQYVVFLPYGEDYGSIEVLENGEMISMVSPEYREDLTYLGMARDQLIFMGRTKEDYETSCHKLYSMDVRTSDLTELGKIPYEENSPVKDAYLEPAQFETNGKDVYFLAAQYEGSGHFLQDYIAVHAAAGEEGSLDLIAYEESEGDDLPALAVLDDGAELRPVKVPSAGLSNGYYGSLDFYDSIHSANMLVPDYVAEYNENSLYITALQTVEVVGDDVFVMRSLHERSPENDIGWRAAYRLDEIRYERFSWKILDDDMTTGDLSALGSTLIPQEGVNYTTPSEDPSFAENGQEVNVYFAEDSGKPIDEHDYFDYAEGDPYGIEIVFDAGETVDEFWLYEYNAFEDYQYEEIYYQRELTPGKPLIARLNFPGDMSAYAFSYYLEDGSERTFILTLSGMDGSIHLQEVMG